MPSFVTGRFLFAAIVAGSALALILLLATVTTRMVRDILTARRARAEREVRPQVLAVTDGDAAGPELVSARGARGRAADRVILGYLAQVRGETAAMLADVLERRGTVDRILRAADSAWSHRRARAAERLGLIASPRAERRLAKLVTGDHNRGVRVVATRALGKMGSPAAAATLLRSLSRASPVPDGVVASALLELGPEAVPALREALRGDRGGGRRQRAIAASVLGLLDDMPSWQGLVANLASEDLEVRTSAVRALGRLGVPQAAGPVAACLRPWEDPGLRAVAARSLGRIGDPLTAPALAGCLDDPHYWVAHNAATSLAEMGNAGRAELSRAAAGGGLGAAHASEALARLALAHGQAPPAPRWEAVSAAAAREATSELAAGAARADGR